MQPNKRGGDPSTSPEGPILVIGPHARDLLLKRNTPNPRKAKEAMPRGMLVIVVLLYRPLTTQRCVCVDYKSQHAPPDRPRVACSHPLPPRIWRSFSGDAAACTHHAAWPLPPNAHDAAPSSAIARTPAAPVL